MLNRPVIIVCKGGAVLRTASTKKNNPSGEQGETEGIVRHLVADGWPVIYFGRVEGELPCEIVRPDVDGIDEWCTAARQRAGFERDGLAVREALGGRTVLCVLNVCGYSPTMSHVDNPKSTTSQAAAFRYSAPMLNLLATLRLPRICVATDPRLYPKDQEMSYPRFKPGWEFIRPAALLDQWDCDASQIVGGVQYERRSVQAHCHSFGYMGDKMPNTGEVPMCVLGHAHVVDGIEKGSWDPWRKLLPGPGEWPDWLLVAGKGWADFRQMPTRQWKGVVSEEEKRRMLSSARCCPVVAHTPGYYTGKPYVLMHHGCVPVLYGRGECSHTWDPHGRYVSLTSTRRCSTWDELNRYVDSLRDDYFWRDEQEYWRQRLDPDWSVLDSCLSDLQDGLPSRDPESWWLRYGGYRRMES